MVKKINQGQANSFRNELIFSQKVFYKGESIYVADSEEEGSFILLENFIPGKMLQNALKKAPLEKTKKQL